MTDFIVIENNVVNVVTDSSSSTSIKFLDDNTNIVEVLDESVIVNNDIVTNILSEGIVGPQGPPGPIGDDYIMYGTRVDFLNDNLLYRGEALPGISESTAGWRIRRITLAELDNDVTVLWAEGNDNFDKKWVDRFTYSYS